MHLDFAQIIASVIILVISGILHEYMHGYVAYKLGDPTAYLEGRLTLNPIAHLSLFESIILPLSLFILSGGRFIFGGAKPVPINPYYFRHPSRDLMLSSAIGPLTNIVIAVIFSFLLGIFYSRFSSDTLDSFILSQIIVINMILGIFNLIPIPPLDGSRILRYFLPPAGKEILDRIEPFGIYILLILLLTGGVGYLMGPIAAIVTFLVNLAANIGKELFSSGTSIV